VYKKDTEDLYLMVNDCGKFQIEKKVTGECTGFARQESKGKWLIDGASVEGKVKVKPSVALKKGDKVSVVKEFKSDDEGEPTKLTVGMEGTVTEIDSEGDAGIKFDKVGYVTYIYKESFSNLKKP